MENIFWYILNTGYCTIVSLAKPCFYNKFRTMAKPFPSQQSLMPETSGTTFKSCALMRCDLSVVGLFWEYAVGLCLHQNHQGSFQGASVRALKFCLLIVRVIMWNCQELELSSGQHAQFQLLSAEYFVFTSKHFFFAFCNCGINCLSPTTDLLTKHETLSLPFLLLFP